jgi:NAD(P)-dependent dehydrogenase (short-subunit alcohol dehydrogenase family)
MWSVWVLCLVIFLTVRWMARSQWFGKSVPPRGKAILVTGAASGIGRSTSRRLMRMGCHVYGADLKEEAVKAALEDVTSEGSFTPLACNVVDDNAVQRMAEAIRSGGKGLWGVINCAGISHASSDVKEPMLIRSGLEKDVATSYMPVMDVNLFGTVRVNSAVFDLIMANQGHIINIASVAGHLGLPGLAPYCASKFAVMGYTDAVRREVAPYGVAVTALCPGFVHTPMVNNIARSTAAMGSSFDYSQTLLKRGRGDESLMVSLHGATLITADQVAADITDALFAHPGPSRTFSDLWYKKLTWQIVVWLPMPLQDVAFRLMERAYGPSRYV